MTPKNSSNQAATDTSQPVFLLGPDSTLIEDLADHLRRNGLRVRTFVNAQVMNNAAHGESPLAVIADLGDANIDQNLTSLSEDHRTSLLFIGPHDDFKQRLHAVRAGGSGYYTHPVNRSALMHQLNVLQTENVDQAGTILIVDNRKGSLGEVRRTLSDLGYAVHYLDEPEQTLPLLQQEPCQLLILNDDLDDLRGTELLQMLRQSLRFQPLPAILFTQSDKRQLDTKATAAGADALLGLPIAAADLAGVVQARLRRARQVLSAHRYCIHRDPDDGLFTRSHFLETLQPALAGHGHATLLWLDVDTGITAQVADTLLRHLPPLALVTRMSRNSAAILLPTLAADALATLLEELNLQLTQTLSLQYRLGTTRLTGRYRNTAAALEAARQSVAQNSEHPASPAATTQSATATAWAQEVQDALREDRFRLVYQPIASLSGQLTSYYEAFVRMTTADGGDILPQEFLAATATGDLAERLDRWVLARALQVLESQQDLHDKPSLFIKLFPDSISTGPALVHWLADALQLAGLEPSRLALQITQQCALSRPSETQSFVAAARELGCQIVLEHFSASGEAGQQLLQSLQPDFVRLASAITQDISSNPKHQKLAEMIAGQCRAVGAKPIAALVQDALNLSVLWRCGIEYIQGYFMQEPVDVFSGQEELGS